MAYRPNPEHPTDAGVDRLTTWRVADGVGALLAATGCRHAFGLPGGEVITLIDALERAGIAFHLARHETAAALMAAGSHAATGAPGLLVTTLGPGLASAVNGIADAALEHVPLIVLSGAIDHPIRALYTHQAIDHAALVRPLVKGSFEVEPESAARVVSRAVALALAEPPGPVHLNMTPATADALVPFGPARARPQRHGPSIDAGDPAISGLASMFSTAERPLIIAGFEAARAGAGITTLAEQLGCPVITTYKAKGLISEDHPLALGAAGLSPLADAILLPVVRAADVVLLIGYDPVEMRSGWIDPAGDGALLVEVGAAHVDHGMHLAHVSIAGDTARVAAALAAALPEANRRRWPGGEPSRARAELAARFAAPGFGPHAVIERLAAAAGGDAVITVDSGAHRILLSQKWVAKRPLSLLQSAGFCTMGAALPLAIGVRLADPTRPVFAVMGDGGLEMCIGELATLRDLGIPLTIVLFQDRMLTLIATKQAAAGLSPVGVALGETDFAMVAEGFGGRGRTVVTARQLDEALADAGAASQFTLIACRFDADAYTNAI